MAELFDISAPKGFLVRLWNRQASVRSLRFQRRCLGLDRPRPAGSPVGSAATTTDLRGVRKALFYLLRTGLAVALAAPGVPAPGHQVAGTYWDWRNALVVKRCNRKVGIACRCEAVGSNSQRFDTVHHISVPTDEQ
jgi:hypothetical protein